MANERHPAFRVAAGVAALLVRRSYSPQVAAFRPTAADGGVRRARDRGDHALLRPDRGGDRRRDRRLRGRLGHRRPGSVRRNRRPRRDARRGGRQLPRRRLLRPGAGRDRSRRGRRPAGEAARRHPRHGAGAVPRPGRALGRDHRPGARDRLRPGVDRRRASRLAARAHRPRVEGPRRLEPGERQPAAVRDRRPAHLRRRRRPRLPRGDGRQRRGRVPRQRDDPRRGRERRGRRRPDQPLLHRPGDRRRGARTTR